MKTFLVSFVLGLLLTVGVGLAQSTQVVVPVGDWTQEAVPLIGEILAAAISALVLWGLHQLPAAIQANISQARIKQVTDLLAHAANYGLNTIAAEEKGKTITLDVGNQVAAQAVQYVVDHGPEWAVDFMGGEEMIKEKIIARLPISPMTSPAVTPTAVSETN